MKAEYVDHMGDDLRVVNSARVSFDKESEWGLEHFRNPDGELISTRENLLEGDQKLIKYLAKHDHWTPFSHVMITMRETVPIIVARQRFKHLVGFTYEECEFTYNEVSRRYVNDTPSFYTPDTWRSRPSGSIKQGSGTGVVTSLKEYEGQSPYNLALAYEDLVWRSQNLYESMIVNDVAPEQARMVLLQSAETSYYVTGSLAAWSRAYKLRSSPDAQLEIQTLAAEWEKVISTIPELKYSWSALNEV